MLRITWVAGARVAPLLKLEGKLLGSWVDEVRKACAEATAGSSRADLDLSAISLVDAAGVQLLRDLIRQGIGIAACSNYVAGLLHRENS